MKKILAELAGTALLLAVITGSGIMGEQLSAGNNAVALLGNSIATGCGLYVLITVLAPISGAHLNPAVSMMFWGAKQLSSKELLLYILAQLSGGMLGVWLTHLLFSQTIIQTSTHPRFGLGIWVSEFVSTLLLLAAIWLGVKYAKSQVAMLVAMTVTAGYWFTSSTFFANPAVAIARGFTDTFVGILPAHVPAFLCAQTLAALLMMILVRK